MNRPSIRLSCALLVVTSGVVHADPPAPSPAPAPAAGAASATAEVAPETIYIVDHPADQASEQGARDRARALGEAPFVTVVHAGDRGPTATVAEAVSTSAGAQLTSLGGTGAFQSISVRGAAPGHTAVLLDGVPLARLAAVTTDLGRFSLDAFGELRFYRGAVPVELGGAGVGGALDLVTRLGRGDHGERWRASIGLGSFGARHLRVHYGDTHGALSSSTTLGYQGATGDYAYFDDNSTLLNQADDGYRKRANNGFDQLDAATRLGASDRPTVGGVRVAWKRQGLPGSTARPAPSAQLTTLDLLVDGQGEARVGEGERAPSAHQLGYVLVERQGLRDPAGELGLGNAARTYTTMSAGASSTWRVAVGAHRLAAGAEVRGDAFRDHDDLGGGGALSGTRGGGAVTAGIDLAFAPELVITPAFRLDVVHSAPTPSRAGAAPRCRCP